MTPTQILRALPPLALIFSLSACGGGGGGGGSDTPPAGPGGTADASGPSITGCFTVNQTVNFSLAWSNVPSGQSSAPTLAQSGPDHFNGQSVTGQIINYPSGSLVQTLHQYWSVTPSGVSLLAQDWDGTVQSESTVFPNNMSVGQTVRGSYQTQSGPYSVVYTLEGFEDVTLGGKTFVNTCHLFVLDGMDSTSADQWVAPGYGLIKQAIFQQAITGGGETFQYNGNL